MKRSSRFWTTLDPDDIGVGEYGVLSLAAQLGVFDLIAQGSGTLSSLARDLPIAAPIVQPLVAALFSYGYVGFSSGGRIILSDQSRRYLVSSSPESRSALLIAHEWYTLPLRAPSYLSAGKRMPVSADTMDAIVCVAHDISKKIAPRLKQDFPFLIEGECSVLDVGCGRMPVFLEFAEQNLGLKVLGVESSARTIGYLQEQIRLRRLDRQVRVIRQRVESFNFSRWGPFDLVFLGHILHWLDKESAMRVLQGCRKALAKYGTVVVFDDYLKHEPPGPPQTVRKNLLLSLQGFAIFTQSQVREMLASAGFRRLKSRVLDRRRILVYAK